MRALAFGSSQSQLFWFPEHLSFVNLSELNFQRFRFCTLFLFTYPHISQCIWHPMRTFRPQSLFQLAEIALSAWTQCQCISLAHRSNLFASATSPYLPRLFSFVWCQPCKSDPLPHSRWSSAIHIESQIDSFFNIDSQLAAGYPWGCIRISRASGGFIGAQ